MRPFLVVITIISLRSADVRAQNRAVDPNDAASIARTEAHGFERLMKGITLTASQQSNARQIIHESLSKVLAIKPDVPDRRARLYELIRKRDADLKALLSSPADRMRFDGNAASLRSPVPIEKVLRARTPA